MRWAWTWGVRVGRSVVGVATTDARCRTGAGSCLTHAPPIRPAPSSAKACEDRSETAKDTSSEWATTAGTERHGGSGFWCLHPPLRTERFPVRFSTAGEAGAATRVVGYRNRCTADGVLRAPRADSVAGVGRSADQRTAIPIASMISSPTKTVTMIQAASGAFSFSVLSTMQWQYPSPLGPTQG